MMYRIRVREIMSRQPIYVNPDSSLAKAAKKLAQHNIGGVLVIEKGILVGILTESDIIKRAFIPRKNPGKTKIKEIMTKNPVFVNADDDLYTVTQIMKKKKVSRLPVLDKKKVVGFLSETDLLRVEPSLIDVLIENLKILNPKFKLSSIRRG